MKNRILLSGLMVTLFLVFPGLSALGQDGPSMDELGELLIENFFQPAERPVDPPPISLNDLGGESVNLSDLQGQVIALNFWATWCPPCRAEMPSMQTLQDRYEGEGFTFVAVNIQEPLETVEEYIDENGYDFPVWMDPNGEASYEYGIQSIPTTYLINRDGKVIARLVGSIEWDEESMYELVETLLEG